MARGCISVSMCSLCGNALETPDHLFLSCPFAIELWNWLKDILGSDIDLSSFKYILSICDKSRSKQVLHIIIAVILNILGMIWHCRNKLRFENKEISKKSVINSIAAAVSLTGNLSSGGMSSLLAEFRILKAFVVGCWPPSSGPSDQGSDLKPSNLSLVQV